MADVSGSRDGERFASFANLSIAVTNV